MSREELVRMILEVECYRGLTKRGKLMVSEFAIGEKFYYITDDGMVEEDTITSVSFGRDTMFDGEEYYFNSEEIGVTVFKSLEEASERMVAYEF